MKLLYVPVGRMEKKSFFPFSKKSSLALKTCFLLLFFALCLQPDKAFSQAVRKYANEYLNIGGGGRGMAMGNANTASVDDANAIYYNPAALASLENKYNGELLHAEYFAGIAKFDYGSFAMKIDDRSGFGLGYVRLGIDDIPNTLDLVDQAGNVDYRRIKSFSVADYGFFLTYARQSSLQGLQYGGTLKIISRQQGEFAQAWGFGFDLAALYTKGPWRVAANLKDATSTFDAWSFNTSEMKTVFETTGNVLPENSVELVAPSLILAAARTWTFREKFELLAELDARLNFDGRRNEAVSSTWFNLDPYTGLEFSYIHLVSLRLGFSGLQKISDTDQSSHWEVQPSLGLGVKLKKISLNYSLSNAASKDFYSNIFSLKFGF